MFRNTHTDKRPVDGFGQKMDTDLQFWWEKNLKKSFQKAIYKTHMGESKRERGEKIRVCGLT